MSGGICLVMIVKDEAPVIADCLRSVRPLVDHWIICDTGSTDGTPDIIRETLTDLPGTLHHRPWVDFAHNRGESLALARPYAAYSLVIDADDRLALPADYRLPPLGADAYLMAIRQGRLVYSRPQLLSNALPWRYEGVLHEFLSLPAPQGRRLPHETALRRLDGVTIHMGVGGARRRSPTERYARDAALIERALRDETDPFLTARYWFYLGQSYRDLGEHGKALAAYERRAALPFWAEERYVSLYQAAALQASLGEAADDEVIATYLLAHEACPTRAEALHGAARFCRIKKRFRQGFDFAARGLEIALPEDGLFIESWIYEYGLLDEYAGSAFSIGRADECLAACRRMLAVPTLPEAERQRIAANLRQAEQAGRRPGRSGRR